MNTIKYSSKNDFLEKAILDGNSITDALSYWDSNYKGTNGASFTKGYYDFLLEGDKTDGEAEVYIKDNGNDNTLKAKGHFIRLAKLAREIRANS